MSQTLVPKITDLSLQGYSCLRQASSFFNGLPPFHSSILIQMRVYRTHTPCGGFIHQLQEQGTFELRTHYWGIEVDNKRLRLIRENNYTNPIDTVVPAVHIALWCIQVNVLGQWIEYNAANRGHGLILIWCNDGDLTSLWDISTTNIFNIWRQVC